MSYLTLYIAVDVSSEHQILRIIIDHPCLLLLLLLLLLLVYQLAIYRDRSQPSKSGNEKKREATLCAWTRFIHKKRKKKATPSCMPCLSTEDRLRPRRGDDGICMCGIRKGDKSVDGKANGTFQLIKGPGRARRRNIKGKKKEEL